MILAALLFSIMGVAVKLASAHYNTWEIVMYRGLVGTIAMGGLLAAQARRRGRSFVDAVATARPGMHVTRSVSGTISLTLWFFAIAGLPIATAMTINYSSPIFIGAWLAWAAWRAGQPIDFRMTLALVAGFAGVLLLLRPTLASDQWTFAVIGTASAVLTAVAYLSVKALAQAGEPNGRIVFWFTAVNALAGLAGALLFGFHALDGTGVALLLAVGLSATIAQLAMTRAYAAGGTLLTANLGFTGILFSSAWGIWLFGDTIDAVSGWGMAIIVAAGIVATWMTARTERRLRAAEET